MFELGSGGLTLDERLRIEKGLEAESDRLRSVAIDIDFRTSEFGRKSD